jgi:hypothetical protein
MNPDSPYDTIAQKRAELIKSLLGSQRRGELDQGNARWDYCP